MEGIPDGIIPQYQAAWVRVIIWVLLDNLTALYGLDHIGLGNAPLHEPFEDVARPADGSIVT